MALKIAALRLVVFIIYMFTAGVLVSCGGYSREIIERVIYWVAPGQLNAAPVVWTNLEEAEKPPNRPNIPRKTLHVQEALA